MWNTSSPSSLLWSSLVPSWSHSHVTHLGYSGSPPHSSTCVHHCCYAFHQELLTFLAGGAFEVPGDTASSPPTPRTRLPCSLYSTNLLSVPQTRRAASPSPPTPGNPELPLPRIFISQVFPRLGPPHHSGLRSKSASSVKPLLTTSSPFPCFLFFVASATI